MSMATSFRHHQCRLGYQQAGNNQPMCLHYRPQKPSAACSSTSRSQQGPCSQEVSLTPPDSQTLQVDRRGIMLCTLATALTTAQPALAELYVSTEDTGSSGPDTTITNLVYLDIGIAPRSFKTAEERTLGDKSVIPLSLADPVGRIVLGLYGNTAPGTVTNFLRMVRSGVLDNTVFSRILPGEYIQAGQQGFYRLGQVEADRAKLQPNPDLLSSTAFKLRHTRPGTLSLSLAENDEDPNIKMELGYRNTEFLITTGPGPVPRLDSENLVFGRVVEGMDIVNTISQVPTFKPSQQSRQLNFFAQAIGDDRAEQVRRRYGKPLKAVVIYGCGELPLPAAATATAAQVAAAVP